MPGSSATKLKAKDPKPDAKTERLMRLAAAQSAAGRNGGGINPLQPEQRKLVAVADTPTTIPAARKSGTLGRTSVIPAARDRQSERGRAASAEPVAWSSDTPTQRPPLSKTPVPANTHSIVTRAPSAIERGTAHAASVVAEGEASQLLKHRFAAALRANGLNAGAFRELFRIPHEVPFADWAADPSARDRRCDAIAMAFLHDDRGLRQHFVAACHAGGLTLEEACRALRLRLADVAAWLASSPASADADAALGLKDQLTLPPLVGPAGSTFANSGTGMLPAIWAFLLSQHRREQRAELNDASYLAVAAETAAYDTRADKRSQRRQLGRVVTVGGGAEGHSAVNESAQRRGGDDTATADVQPSLGAAAASSSLDISKLTGVFVPKPARARTLEVDLPRVTSVIAESPILRHRVAPEFADDDGEAFPMPEGAAEGAAIARLRDAKDDLDGVQEEDFEVADLRPMSPLRTVAAVMAQTASVRNKGVSTTASGSLRSSLASQAALGRNRRVVPLLVHDGEGHLKARPRRPEVLRARAKPHEKDQFRLEQAVSDLRFRRVADTYAPPSGAALDRLVTMAEELWESSSDDAGAASSNGGHGGSDDEEGSECIAMSTAGNGESDQRDVPHALRHVLPPRPVPLSASPLPPTPPGHGALDAHQSAAPGSTALDGRRVLASRDKPRALLRTPMLEGAKAKDGLRPVEYGGKRLVTPTEGALRPCERTLLRLMVDKRIRGPHAKELQTALHDADARKKRKLPPVSIGLL